MNAQTNDNTEPQFFAKGQIRHQRMRRKEFHHYLYKLFESKGRNDVTADSEFEWCDGHVEIFDKSPAGRIIAIHHSYAGFNYQCVDVIWLLEEAKVLETAL